MDRQEKAIRELQTYVEALPQKTKEDVEATLAAIQKVDVPKASFRLRPDDASFLII